MLNSTVIGDYEQPKVRLPGGGGAPEIAAMAGEVIVMLRQSPRSFVEQVDFRSSVPGGQPLVVITDLGVLRPDPDTRELTLEQVHPGVTAEQAREATGWDLKVAGELRRDRAAERGGAAACCAELRAALEESAA